MRPTLSIGLPATSAPRAVIHPKFGASAAQQHVIDELKQSANPFKNEPDPPVISIARLLVKSGQEGVAGLVDVLHPLITGLAATYKEALATYQRESARGHINDPFGVDETAVKLTEHHIKQLWNVLETGFSGREIPAKVFDALVDAAKKTGIKPG